MKQPGQSLLNKDIQNKNGVASANILHYGIDLKKQLTV
jgi:hypothetical protein